MSFRLLARLVSLVLIVAPCAALTACGEADAVTPVTMAKAAAAVGSVNGLCPVMERLVTEDGGFVDYKGQKVAFCCPGCAGKFNSNPEKYVDAMKAYPAKYGYKP